jgi:Mor family transcriptional regulator
MKGQFKIYGPTRKRGAKQKLSAADKTNMRNDFIRERMTISDLMKKYKMSQSMVYAHLKATKPSTSS